jgi:hypothetical protein
MNFKSTIRDVRFFLTRSFIHRLYMYLKQFHKFSLIHGASSCENGLSATWYGDHDLNADYFMTRFLGGDFHVNSEKRILKQVASKIVENQINKPDFYFQEIPPAQFAFGNHQLVIPAWAEFDFVIEGKDFEKRYPPFQNIRNYTRKAGFKPVWPELTKEIINMFYDEMAIPFITARKGKQAMDFSRAFFMGILKRNGRILFLERDGRLVAGMVITFGEIPMYHTVGIRMNDEKNHFADGAFKSLYYFAHLQLQADGFKRVTLGGSRPFLDDHSFMFKMQIGSELVKNRIIRNEAVLFHLSVDNERVRNWLEQNPFIVLDNQKEPHPVFFTKYNEAFDSGISPDVVKKTKYYAPTQSIVYLFDLPSGHLPDQITGIELRSFNDLIR